MKRATALLAGLLILLAAGAAMPAEKVVSWDPSEGAQGYRIYKSTDNGATWDAGTDVGNVTKTPVTVPDHGIVLLRVSAYNGNGEAIRSESGLWVNMDWVPPVTPKNVGIE